MIFLLIGSLFVRGRRAKVQAEANKIITERTAEIPDLPAGADIPVGVDSLFRLNRRWSQLPCVTGVSHGLFGDYDASIEAMAEAVNEAEATVHVEFFITAWDDTTDIFCTALADAVKRGVKVRLLYDDIASRGYPGFKELNSRLTAAGIEWHEMMPIKPFKGKWRRPDLRNHRKLVVVDSKVAFMGSQNMIDSSYLKPKNIKAGRHWKDLNIKISGEIVMAASSSSGTADHLGWRVRRSAVRPVTRAIHHSADERDHCGPDRRWSRGAPGRRRWLSSASEQALHQLRLGGEHEIVGGLAERDPVGALGDVPLAGVSVVAGEEPRVGGHGNAQRLAGLELDAFEAEQAHRLSPAASVRYSCGTSAPGRSPGVGEGECRSDRVAAFDLEVAVVEARVAEPVAEGVERASRPSSRTSDSRPRHPRRSRSSRVCPMNRPAWATAYPAWYSGRGVWPRPAGKVIGR